MFISNQEKQSISDKLEKLTSITNKLATEIIMLSAKIKVLEGKNVPTKPSRTKVTPEHKKQKQREYNRRYAAKKKLLAKEVQNVSS
jgi:hypothetical protein